MSPMKYLVACLLSASFVAGCGGGLDASIGGTVSGLGSGLSVTLQNNGSDTITVSGNQSFAFATHLTGGAAYSVTVSAQPAGQTCSVANASGVVDSLGNDITNITVTCATTSSVGGTVSGLAAGTSVTLANQGQLLAIAANGAFAFPGTSASGSNYDVTVSVQPVGETCTVANATGTVIAGVQSNATVTCK